MVYLEPDLPTVSDLLNASYAARCVACHGVRSHPVPVALAGECSMPVV
jgi:mono/diheme cytochrome c family protein